MDDKEIIGRSDYIKFLTLVAVVAVPVALLTLIFLVLYTKGGQLVRETLPAALHISQPLCTILVATLGCSTENRSQKRWKQGVCPTRVCLRTS
jgi:hypothetical protein